MKPRRPSLFRRIVGSIAFTVTVLAALWLLACVAASFISPQAVKYLALLSITAPFAIIANVLVAIAWLVFAYRKWPVAVPILALALSYRIIPVVFGMHPFSGQDMSKGSNELKVMSWNVHGMGIFDRPADNTADDKIIAHIKKEAPDIVCLTEYYTLYNNALKPYSTRIMQECGYKEYRFSYDNTLGLKIYLGIALFSRYPISNFHAHPLHARDDGWEDVHLMQCDVTLPQGKVVRVFSTHLQSFLLSDNEKVYLEEVQKRDSEIHVSRSKSFIKRFDEAYLKRSIQADKAALIIAQSPHPVILCGDFNDLPGSYTYMRMRGKLTDAFAKRGFGIGHTYNRLSPTLRIDYIFYDAKAFELLGFQSRHTALSDHNPLIANFRVGK